MIDGCAQDIKMFAQMLHFFGNYLSFEDCQVPVAAQIINLVVSETLLVDTI